MKVTQVLREIPIPEGMSIGRDIEVSLSITREISGYLGRKEKVNWRNLKCN